MKASQKIMKQRRAFLVSFAFSALLALANQAAVGQTSDTNASAITQSEADKAWKDVEKATRPPMPPAEWQGKRPTQEQMESFRAQQGVLAGQGADKVKDFYTHFPDHPKAAEARKKEYEMLRFAVYLGNTNKLAALEAIEKERLNDPNLSEDQRLEIRVQAIQRDVSIKQREGEEAMIAAQEKGGRELLRDFPKRGEGYQILMEVAEESGPDKALALAKEIADSAASSEGCISKDYGNSYSGGDLVNLTHEADHHGIINRQQGIHSRSAQAGKCCMYLFDGADRDKCHLDSQTWRCGLEDLNCLPAVGHAWIEGDDYTSGFGYRFFEQL